MPRQPRYPLPDIPQHIIQRGNNRQPVFFADEDYRFYLACLQRAAEQHACAIHAYVFMTNHVHLLVTPSRANGIAKLMQSLGRRYVQYVNVTYQRTGTLWEGRYRACLVDADTYLFTCSRYIELNPVRAHMVPHPGAYPWSSYRWHACGESDPVITDHPLYHALGSTSDERQAAYRGLFEEVFDAHVLRDIRTTVHQCRVLGTERFKDAIEAVLARRVRPGTPGRPRKNPDTPATDADITRVS